MSLRVLLPAATLAGVLFSAQVASARGVVLVGDPIDMQAAAVLLEDAGIAVDRRHDETLAADCARRPVTSIPPPPAPPPTTKLAGDERVLFVFASDGSTIMPGWCRMKIVAAQPMKAAALLVLAPSGEWNDLMSFEQVKRVRAMVFARGLRSVALMLEITGELRAQLRLFVRRRPARRVAATEACRGT